MDKRRPNTSKYIAAFSLSTLIFITGIFLGNYIAQTGLASLRGGQEELRAQLLGLDLRDKLIASQNVCSLSVKEILEDKVDLGRKVEDLEKRLGKLNPEVLRQKELYELIEIKTWLLLKERNEKCVEDNSIILFFYTNIEGPSGSVKKSEDQGIILNALYRKYPEDIKIFSFDINIDNPASNTLRGIYGIASGPSIVIKEKVYVRFMELDEIKEVLALEW